VYQAISLGGGERAPQLQAGARYDIYRLTAAEGDRFGGGVTRDFNNLSGSIGLSVPVAEHLSANVSAARSFRAPTVEELFSDGFHAATGAYELGDPELGVETNSGLEAVLRAQSERINAQLSAFYNRIDNYIYPLLSGRASTTRWATASPFTSTTSAGPSCGGWRAGGGHRSAPRGAGRDGRPGARRLPRRRAPAVHAAGAAGRLRALRQQPLLRGDRGAPRLRADRVATREGQGIDDPSPPRRRPARTTW
jgi:outer membrane receptor protein involved in Fe transport